MRHLAWLLGVSLLAGASAQTCGAAPGWPDWVRDGVYTGTLAGKSIWLNLSRRAPDETRYFYAHVGVDLQLEAGRAGPRLSLQETVWRGNGPGDVVTGCFTLGADLRGEWRSPDGKTRHALTLRRVDVAALPLNLPSSPGLRKLRQLNSLAFVKLNRAWTVRDAGKNVREPLSGLVYPRLPGERAALNAALQDRQLEHALSALECRAQLPEPVSQEDGYGLEVAVTFRSPTLLSLREDVSYFCGGAHPGGYTQGVTLDRRTGRHLAVTDLWPALTPAQQKARYLPLARPRLDDDCRAAVQEMDAAFSAHLTPQGLVLTPTSLPHVAAACAEPVTLPYATLRPLLKADSPYRADLSK